MTAEQRHKVNNGFSPCVGCMWRMGEWSMRPSYDEPMLEGTCQKPDGNFTYMTDTYCPYSKKEDNIDVFNMMIHFIENATHLRSYDEVKEITLASRKKEQHVK